jgi:signal transduction histidine kinase/ActR/RegA family two-component response regulator
MLGGPEGGSSMTKKRRPEVASTLRAEAEARLSERVASEGGNASRSVSEMEALVHELQVHQIELEMQNEELLRSRAEAEEARRRYASLYDFAPIGYFTISLDSTIREVNLTGARSLQVDRSALVARRLGAFVREADRPSFNAALAAAMETQAQQTCDVMLAPESGVVDPTRLLQLTVSVAEGDEEELRVVAVDATERRRIEEQLRASQKLEAIGQLAGGVAHDFNNLLTVIMQNVGAALELVGPQAPLHPSLLEVKAAAERAAALTRQLLAFSTRQAIRPQVVDLNVLVRNVADMLRRIVGENIELVLSLDANATVIEIDPAQLDQVMMNLAVNARDAMTHGGTLRVSTTGFDRRDDRRDPDAHGTEPRPRPHVRLTVTDSGTGMDARTMEHIFEPFFTTKEVGRGTGLGLSTVFGIVKRCGGTIGVHSKLGNGTTFEIDFPRSLRSLPQRASSVKETEPPRGAETIVVVEDEAALLRIVVRMLGSAGYTVLAAGGGAEALRKCEDHDGAIDLALSDVVMPGMSGVAFAERLRSTRPDVRVLYMSGYTADALACGHGVDPAIQLLHKPFTPDELRRKIREVLDAPPDVRPKISD